MSHSEPSASDLLYGVTAEFHDPDQLVVAAKKAREAGYTNLDAYTPFPVHGLDDAIGFRDTKVQWTIFIFGLIGFTTGVLLQWWTSVIDYPLNIGGRPLMSWPSFFPVSYECTILFAGLSAVFGMLAFNGLPRPNHPIFNAENFERATQDKFFLAVERGKNESMDVDEVSKFLRSLGADHVAPVYADEVSY